MKKMPLTLVALFASATTAFAAEYEIGTLEELREFMEAVHVEDFAGDTITLTADIDCEGGRFNTGDPEYPSTFRGTFDGGGHVISNFVHAATGSTQEGYGVAMFDFAETGAAILNLTLEGTLPGTASGAYAAPFVLAVESPLGLFMDNCHFRGSVTNYYHAAGLVGFASSGTGAGEVPSVTLTNCSVRGEIVSTWVYTAGGLVAKGMGVQAFDCSVESELHGGRTGGLVGEAYGGSFEGCSFGGTMRPDRETVGNCIQGGLAAETSNAVFRACTSAVGFSSRAAAAGGAAGVTHGSAAFHDCSATVEAPVPYGRFGGFVGWTAGAETFSNCTATMTVDAIPVINPETHQTNIYSLATGGFAGSVASDGALFVDCTASARGNDLKGGFYYNQQPYSTNSAVGSNTFLRCHVVDSTAKEAGFCSSAWNCAFEGCTVRGGTGGAGFVQSAGRRPDDSNSSTYAYEQTSTFTDCSVHGTRASSGFVMIANSSDKNAHTNIFRRCRAGCLYGTSNLSGALDSGFGYTLNKGTLIEDCAAYGIADMGDFDGGFASDVRLGTTIRRSVAAVIPRTTDNRTAGFVYNLSSGAVVEDCYAVCGPVSPAVYGNGYYDYQNGYQGGFVRRCRIGQTEGSSPIRRSFALWPVPATTCPYVGSFAAVTPYSDYSTDYFEDCYRPEESPIGDCNNADAEGVEALTAAQFASATAATMPNYDFQNVWRAPGGGASSPYLDASVDADTNFWFFAGVIGAEGRVLVNGEAPREAYPAGSVLTVQAVADNPDIPFAGWVGDGFADPSAQTTTYTVKNVSAIAAKFCIPIYTVDDWTNMVHASFESSPTDAYALMNDLDFTDYIASNGWNYISGYYPFAGKLFGQGHTISGLVRTNSSTRSTYALFGSVSDGAEIRDLTVESSNVPDQYNTGYLAGLANSVGSGVLISNCHAKVDWQGVYPDSYVSSALESCQYYGLARDVNGVGIRIVDCTVEGKLAGGTAACGFVGSASMTGGEIARCAVFADVSTLTNRTGGTAAGFAGEITLSGGAVVRECFSAGSVDAAGDAAGFACRIDMRDDQSQVRDCYSTAEVIGGENQNPAGFAGRIADINDEGGVLPVANCWFGGTVRVRGPASQYYQPYGFAYSLEGDASLENCAWVAVDGVKEAGTAGATAISQAASRKAASWPGYDFAGTWSLSEDGTTPYFAWSLADGTDFRLFAVQEEGKTITIGESAAPGTTAEVSASATDPDLFFCQWTGGATYTNAAVNPSALLADNHRTARCVWGKAIRTRADLEAVASDPSGTYGLGADIDLGGEPWTPLCQDEYTPFTGTIYGNGHTISNLTVETETARAGLFGGLGSGATIADLNLADPVVRGANCVGTLAGYVEGATISGCTVSGADVTATSERAGCFVGQLEGGATVTRCSATGRIAGSGRYVGGFVGSVAGTTALEKCFALAEVSGAGEGVGGFAGYAEDTPSFSECFACGGVDSTGNGTGGFAGYLSGSPAVSDCYALADVKGGNYVGGFAGHLYYCNGAFERCYAAGREFSSGEAGGFVGRQYRGSPAFADCFRSDGGRGDVGTADVEGVDALDAAGFLDTGNFAAFLETDKWTQADGLTQPYFAWSLVGGKMTLSGSIAGTGDGEIMGLGAYEPGTVVQISAVPSGSVFLEWLGNAPYADASAQTTTITLDNFRIVTAEFGKLIMNVADLYNVTNALSGSFALGANIDLSNETWTPIGSSSTPFTGSFYGGGYAITGLSFSNTSSGDSNGSRAGLFRYAKDATFVGVMLEDVDVNGYQYVGALAGEVQGATTVRDCSASGTAKSSNGCVGMLVGRVYNANGTVFEGCEAAGEVVSAGASAGGLVGDISNSTVSFGDCGTDVAVSGTGGNNKGGLVGCIESGGSVSFTDCWTEGDVTAPSSQYVGGFVGNATRPVRCENCQTFGDTSGSSYTGGFVGQASGEGSTFADCVANGAVTTATANGSYAGGFVGYASGAKSRYEDCSAYGAVSAGSGGQVGGFVGQTYGAGIVFEECLARGTDVRTTGSAIGGFAGKSTASNEFTRCQAKALAVSGSGSVGGFVGSSEGGNSQYAECEAHGAVAATGSGAGGFAGQTTGGGTRYSECRALGSAATMSNRAGGFAGYVSGANAFWRCFSAGSATASHEVGGFLGYNNGGGTTATECFALGDTTATRTGNDAIAGGFLGYGYYGVGFTDCYCLGTVKGERVVGGFAGRLYDSGNVFTRCYAAGALDCTGTYAGAFVGYPQRYGAITDCAALCTGDLHAFGTGTAGTSEAKENIAEYDAAGMKDSGNFDTWLAIDDADGAVWTQADGVTQPYLTWSSPDGDLMVYASIGGSASGRIAGAGTWYAPGEDATVTVVPDEGGFFAKWTGSTPYRSRTSQTTQIPMDNHRVAAALLGKYITTPDELDAVRSDLAGIYGLGNDVDLAGRDWTPLGNDSTKFSGSFYGRGHAVKNLTCTNGTLTSSSTNYRGLFGCTLGATLDSISVVNCDVAGYQYVGALVGRVYEGTAISGCSASGKVRASSGYAGGLVGAGDSCTFSIRNSSAAVETTGGNNVGGFIGRINSSGTPEISDCRADGFVSGSGSVGGFVGYVSAPARISGCAARGDVKSTGNDFGGFIGYLGVVGATNANCWASGAVWGTGSNCGSFLGNWYYSRGTVEDCEVSASANGARQFCGSSAALTGKALTDSEIAQNSVGWPKVAKRSNAASLTRIATAADLLAIASSTANFASNYVLVADIDLDGAAWTPIGNSSTGFTGEFYGKNHVISNFVVNSSSQCAGLFGSIAGGRVEGVQAFGRVTSTSSEVGGFAGRICSRSLVKGCSFIGTVSSSSTKVGGFAGYIYDQPSVFECCAVGTVVKTGSANNYAYVGGFVGQHQNGFVADSYANANVAAVGTSGRVGGFAGEVTGGKIETTYCSGLVDATSTTYVGAFGGNVAAESVTNSYYNSGVTDLLAQGQSGKASISYVGITPVAGADMKTAASFPAFDFEKTWKIEEGEKMPYLLAFLVQRNAFMTWLEDELHMPPDTDPLTVVNGVPLLARYVYGIVPMNKQTDNDGNPLVDIRIGADGKPWFQLAPQKWADDYGMRFSVFWSRDLVNWQTLGECRFDQDGDEDPTACHPPVNTTVEPRMFFKYRIEIGND